MVNSIDGYKKVRNGHYNINGEYYYFRSVWEANIALYLDFLVSKGNIVSWSFENKFYDFPIKHGTTRYLPDFEVIGNNGKIEIWEVKGYMDAKSKTKLSRMAKYYPGIKIVLIDKNAYRDIKNIVGKMLKFYE